ncbi:hypothetical protein ALQ16_205560 [Pseudomonas syringae pv. actinidiae]|uniref:Uncharacterized protein n=1 Tax=Pseudomonas avellanae TaxID=46257 RepID=A0A3M5TVA8_9PSED|nr:hypothetical protein ALQ16_205560 [Pseudomonas syringae pv. actinidiae]RMU37416.1 hypothetical protein ALP32_200309 [Pseudomonas avellanae]
MLTHRLLDNSILRIGYAQQPFSAIRFTDRLTLDRARLVTPGQKLFLDARPMLDQVSLDIFGCNTVDTRRTFVGPDFLERTTHVVSLDHMLHADPTQHISRFMFRLTHHLLFPFMSSSGIHPGVHVQPTHCCLSIFF